MSEQATEPISAIVTERVLANLADFWANPSPDRYTHRMPQRIAGGEFDQAIPEGVSNPYWEIVRQLPLNAIPGPWETHPEPDAYWFGPGHAVREFGGRHSLCTTFSWSVISPGDVAWMTERLAGRGVLEIGAGSGYWAWQLTQAGVDVVACDPHNAQNNNFVTGEGWFPVMPGDHRDVKDHPHRSLLMVWPSYSEPWATEALKLYAGDQLFYAGEGWGGCTADDAFFSLLEAEWERVDECPYHITFHGIHCYLAEYRRKS